MDLVRLVESVWPLWFALWTGWAVQAVLAALMVRKFFNRRIIPGSRWAYDLYRPRAVVMVPFKGAEDDVPAAVKALLTQHYQACRLVCIVESEQDPAYPILQRELGRYPAGASEIVVAGCSPDDRGQKVHNLLRAIERVDPASDDADVWVFADSDAVPGRHWLGKLVGPLSEAHVGVSTGYRWLVPVAGAKVWSDLASVLNSSVASFLGRDRFIHAWGGSMAIRVATAREAGLTQWLSGAVSDDYQVTRMCRAAGLEIRFVPECLVASPVDLNLDGLLNFAHRQHLITRVHAPWMFVGGVGLTGFYTLSFLSAWAMMAHWLYHKPAGWAWLMPLGTMLVVFGANVMRSHYRRRVVRSALGEATVRQMRRTFRIDRYFTAAWMALHLLLLLRAAVGRAIRWRGIEYRIDGPQNVQRVLFRPHHPP